MMSRGFLIDVSCDFLSVGFVDRVDLGGIFGGELCDS